MIDSVLAVLALRNRALAAVAATTGSMSLSATATGYARTTGSFLSDGFRVGMEATPTGFPANPVDIVKAVTALTLTTQGTHAVAAASGSRTLSVGLPVNAAWENVGTSGGPDFKPVHGRPYIEESFVPGTSRSVTFPSNGGLASDTGIYVLRWYGLTGSGLAIRASVDALKRRFTAGTGLTLSDGTVMHSTGPYTGSIMNVEGGWSVLTLTVPWESRSTNTVAA